MNSTYINGVEYRHYDHLYGVSVIGDVLSLKKLAIVTPRARPDGYCEIGRRRLLHRMVATCWLNKPTSNCHVHHKNGDRADNRTDNLTWITPKEHRAEHPEAGRKSMPEDEKQRLRERRLGSKLSNETRKKISAALKRIDHKPPSWKGKQHSIETKQKMCANHAKNTQCQVDGIIYPSFSAAARDRNEKPLSLRKRCLSASFPNYLIV